MIDEIHAHIDDQIKTLRRRLAGLPFLQVLATLAVTTMTHDPEAYKESESRYSGLYAEYVMWLYLVADPKPDLVAPVLWGGDFQDVLDLLDDIIESTRSYYMIKAQIARQSPETAEEEIGLRAVSGTCLSGAQPTTTRTLSSSGICLDLWMMRLLSWSGSM